MGIVVEASFLKPVATTTTLARTKPIDLAQFYRHRSGLWVSDSLCERFDLRVVSSAPARPYVASLLKKNAYDQRILLELPSGYLSTLEDIAGFIEIQADGQEGLFLTNGCANIFYVEGRSSEVFSVHTFWLSDRCGWGVRDWQLDEHGQWRAERQVFCPGTAEF